MKNFCRSHSLPFPQDYSIIGKNPILSCLVDQMKQDSKLSTKYPNQATFLKSIIKDLEARKISWPNRFTLMSSEKWIQKMRLNPSFYWDHAKNPLEMQKYEDLLLDLVAQSLKRKINLVPLLEKDEASTFTKILANFVSTFRIRSQQQFHLLSCQSLYINSFFISVFRRI